MRTTQTLRCHLSAVMIGNLRDSRVTTTDVRKRLSYIRDRPPPTSEPANDGTKIQIIRERAKKKHI